MTVVNPVFRSYRSGEDPDADLVVNDQPEPDELDKADMLTFERGVTPKVIATALVYFLGQVNCRRVAGHLTTLLSDRTPTKRKPRPHASDPI